MLRLLCGCIFYMILALPVVGQDQDRKLVTVFTEAARQQAAQLVRNPVTHLRSATYYDDGSVASLYYAKGATTRRRFRTSCRYEFYPDGKPKSRGRRYWLGLQAHRTKYWNEAGQLVEIYRRYGASTSFTHVSRQLTYDNSRVVRIEIEKKQSGCFASRLLKHKVITFTDHGRVVSRPDRAAATTDGNTR